MNARSHYKCTRTTSVEVTPKNESAQRCRPEHCVFLASKVLGFLWAQLTGKNIDLWKLHRSHQINALVFRQAPGVPSATPLADSINCVVSAALVGIPGQGMATNAFVPTYSVPSPTIPSYSVPMPTIPRFSMPTPTIPAYSEQSPTITQAVSASPAAQTAKATTTAKDVAEGTTTNASQPARQTANAIHMTQSSSRKTTTTTDRATLARTIPPPRTVSSSRYTSISQSSTNIPSNALPSPSQFLANPDVALTSLKTLATSTITPNGRFLAGGNQTSLVRTSAPRVTATAISSVEAHRALSPGTKAAIALGSFVFVLIVAVVATVFWRRHRPRKRDRLLSYSAPPQRHSRASTPVSPPSYSKMVDGGLPALDEQHPATIWGSKQRHEMRLAATPRFNSWAPAATSLNPAELDGGWAPSEIDGRPK